MPKMSVQTDKTVSREKLTGNQEAVAGLHDKVGDHYEGGHHEGGHHEGGHHEGVHHEGVHHEGGHHEGGHHGAVHHGGGHHGGGHHGSGHHDGSRHGSGHHDGSRHGSGHHGSGHHEGSHHGNGHHGRLQHERTHSDRSQHERGHGDRSHHERGRRGKGRGKSGAHGRDSSSSSSDDDDDDEDDEDDDDLGEDFGERHVVVPSRESRLRPRERFKVEKKKEEAEKVAVDETSSEEWVEGEAYGESGRYLPFRFYGEGVESSSLWETMDVRSVTSEVTPAEVEETEEEKEARKEREVLIEEVRQKILDRMVFRRRNAFLQKKLIEHFKKRRMDNVFKEEPRGIDLEKKYLMRLHAFQEFKRSQETEIEELTQKMEQYENETKVLEAQLQDKITNFTARAKEISLNLILSKTGKKLSEKTVDRLLARQVKKNEEKGKKKLQYIKVKNLIEEKEARLRAMEYIAEGLNIVDCEQMKIDNQNFSDKIEEKEDELTKMRLKTEEMMQNLAQIREKAYAIDGDIELMEEKVYDVENKFVETRERLTKARKRRDFLREEYVRLKASSGLLTRDNLLEDFESSIGLAKTLSKQLEKLKKLMQEKAKQEVELTKAVIKSKSRLDDFPSAIESRNFSKRSYSSKILKF